MADAAVDTLLQNLKGLLQSKADYILAVKDEIQSLYNDFTYLSSFLRDSEGKRGAHEEVKGLVRSIGNMACTTEEIIDSYVVDNVSPIHRIRPERTHSSPFVEYLVKIIISLCSIFDSPCLLGRDNLYAKLRPVHNIIEFLKEGVTKIYNDFYEIHHPQAGFPSDGISARLYAPDQKVTMVGFDEEVLTLTEQLTQGRKREIISVVGMAGQGKTTLARNLYNHPYIEHYFHIRAFIHVTQNYQMRDLLLALLRSLSIQPNERHTWSEEEPSGKLRRALLGRRYLMVLDDLWDMNVWDRLILSFPNDNNGSKILFTSRLTGLASKVFGDEPCPPELVDIGKKIAIGCQGLPLALVVIGGLLANASKTQKWWNQVAENITFYVISGERDSMNALILSYNHLPRHLKACFLYLGAFLEDKEVPVRRLTRLWIAERLVVLPADEQKCLEDLAEDYLKDLIGRNLVIIGKRNSGGGIKTCGLHDLLRELCLRMAKEENFLKQAYYHRLVHFCSSFSQSSVETFLSQEEYSPNVRSVLSCEISARNLSSLTEWDDPFITKATTLLTVLDLSSLCISEFPKGITLLVLLRYLSLWVEVKGQKSHPMSIGHLINLETFIFRTNEVITFARSFWKMEKLRHLLVHSGSYRIYQFMVHKPSILKNLQSITLCPGSSCQSALHRFPNLKKLVFWGPFVSEAGYVPFPDLSFLSCLKNLKLCHKGYEVRRGGNLKSFSLDKLPMNIKSLSLEYTALDWKEISMLGMLPNLEVLKLKDDACAGPCWKTSDGGFRRLIFLKLSLLDIVEWVTCSDHFPCLQHIVLQRCKLLEEIQLDLENVYTLKSLEITNCSESAAIWAWKIKEEKQSMNSKCLNIQINPLPELAFCDDQQSSDEQWYDI
ncbi:unnamed protein product [Thlaspi arvense]|uniref:Uncharacterized protein n=1 Tax=Thlaspi arvense TaxID=13288 RepID=A0AAU9RJU5_THLAR|nr:unnamed protein product [Thlaspi arvense]